MVGFPSEKSIGDREGLAPMANQIPSARINLDQLAFLLDVDGTILDIAPTPQAVHASASLRQTLSKLTDRVEGALALVSGRPLEDLDHIFTPLKLAAIGGHGAEIRACANLEPDRSKGQQLDQKLRQRLQDFVAQNRGLSMEDKGFSVALHYRAVPEKARVAFEFVEEICADDPNESFEILPGKSVIEIKRAGFNKGTAVRKLMTHQPFIGRRPIFLGDDKTDESAFAVLPDFGGIPISVGRILPGVFCHFDSPEEVRNWLQRLAISDGHI
jgi:trehalose 6-phosphate phosphatase